jgi:cyclohexyl-isocyanide hydratase
MVESVGLADGDDAPERPHLEIGLLVFPGLTQLDLAGPYEVFSRLPDTQVRLLWKAREPLRTEWGLRLEADTALAEVGALDLLCVPGGPGVFELLGDEELVGEIRRLAGRARRVACVCTGAFPLGAAGLLQGRRATTHWASRDLLPLMGAIPAEGRVVVDGHLVTGGGGTDANGEGLVRGELGGSCAG